MKKTAVLRRTMLMTAAAVAAGAVAVIDAQSTAAASTAKAKEVVALMSAKKLDSFAARDPENKGHYVAVLLVPQVQLLLVSANYSRDNDIEYSLYHKLYQNAYQDLRSGVFGSEKFFVDDALGDGLVAIPPKNNPQQDVVTIDTTKRTFDGLFDPKGKDAKKPAQDVYMKAFTDADARYSHLLDVLIAQLKASEKLPAAGSLR